MARAAAARGTVMGLSSFASKPVEEVVAANPETFFQMYWTGTRDGMLAAHGAGPGAGAVGLIVTLDWSFSHGRDWGSPHDPRAARPQDHGAVRARGAAPPAVAVRRTLRTGAASRPHRPQPGAPRAAERPTFFGAYGEWMQTTAAHLGRRRLDARAVGRARSCSRASSASTTPSGPSTPASTAISVSNHGGNNLDGTPATDPGAAGRSPTPSATRSRSCSTAASAAAATSSRRVALGARAVMIGRAYLWGLAANGQAGVENVLDILRGGIDSALLGLGRSSVHELSPDDLVIPAGFAADPRRARVSAAAGRRMTTARHDRLAHSRPGPGRRRHGWSWCRSAPPSSTGRTCRWTPTRVIAESVAGRAAEASARLTPPPLVAPALAYGASGEHAGFPGTISIGTRRPARRGRRARPLAVAVGRARRASSTATAATPPPWTRPSARLRAEGHDVAWAVCAITGGDAHAGRTETSLMLHLAPDEVGSSRPRRRHPPAASPAAPAAAHGVKAVSPTGVLGDPAGASAEEGRRHVRTMVSRLVGLITAATTDERGRLLDPAARDRPGTKAAGR